CRRPAFGPGSGAWERQTQESYPCPSVPSRQCRVRRGRGEWTAPVLRSGSRNRAYPGCSAERSLVIVQKKCSLKSCFRICEILQRGGCYATNADHKKR